MIEHVFERVKRGPRRCRPAGGTSDHGRHVVVRRGPMRGPERVGSAYADRTCSTERWGSCRRSRGSWGAWASCWWCRWGWWPPDRRTESRRPPTDGGGGQAEAEQVGGLQRPLLQRPASRQGSLPDRAAGDQDDQQHAQGLVDQDRDLLLRPPAGRPRAGGGPPSRGAGADAPQRPLGDARHEGGARRDRQEPQQGQLHLQVQAELPGSGQRVQQPAHEVLPVQPGREVRGRRWRWARPT